MADILMLSLNIDFLGRTSYWIIFWNLHFQVYIKYCIICILIHLSFSIMWLIFYNYILFKRFYFDDKISLNHVVDFLQLHPLQKVLFWWQDLSQSCGRFSSATSSSKGSILVTRSLSILWRIFFSYILFNRFYFGDKISLNHVADFLHLHTPQKVLFWWQDLSII